MRVTSPGPLAIGMGKCKRSCRMLDKSLEDDSRRLERENLRDTKQKGCEGIQLMKRIRLN